MNKTIGYWLENLSAYLFGIAIFIISYQKWTELGFSNSKEFLENVVSISATLFGFLLATLTLIIQGDSKTIKMMKSHGSFTRLISLNKRTVLASIINCIFSFSLSLFKESLSKIDISVLKILESLNVGIFLFVIINTLIFTLIFYRIIISDEEE